MLRPNAYVRASHSYHSTIFLLLFVIPCAVGGQQAGYGSGSESGIPSAPTAENHIADVEMAISNSDWPKAQALLDRWLAQHPTDVDALSDAAFVANAQNRMDDAAGFYRRAVVANPKSFLAHLSFGLLLARQAKLSEARDELVIATTLNAGQTSELKARAWRALARIDQSRDAAAASFELIEALKLTPETREDTLLAASLAEKVGEYEAAATAYRKLLAEDAKSVDAQAGLAHLLMTRKQYSEAETLLRGALDQSPDDLTLTAQLAAVLAAEDKAEALPLLRRLHSAHPDDRNIDSMLAQVLATAGDAAGSDAIYKKLLAEKPEDVDLLLAHARNLIWLMQYPAAFAAYDQATKLASGNPDAWAGLAFAAERTHQPAVTLRALDMRAKSLPENASSYFLRATAYDTLRQRSAAVKYYHLFLDASAGKKSDQQWQAQQRLKVLEK